MLIHEVSEWAKQYRGFLSSIVRADPSLEHDDLLSDLYVLFLEKRDLTVSDVAKKYHMRKIGFTWVPEQPNSNWSDWETGGQNAEAVEGDVCEVVDRCVPGMLASSAQVAEKMNLTRRRGQQIIKKQTAIIAAQVHGVPDEYGQMGLFADGALGV
jgi:hypothetical protein